MAVISRSHWKPPYIYYFTFDYCASRERLCGTRNASVLFSSSREGPKVQGRIWGHKFLDQKIFIRDTNHGGTDSSAQSIPSLTTLE